MESWSKNSEQPRLLLASGPTIFAEVIRTNEHVMLKEPMSDSWVCGGYQIIGWRVLLAGSGCAASHSRRDRLGWDQSRLIDLTHAFGADTIVWPTEQNFQLVVQQAGETPGGHYSASNRLEMAEHGGTHIDAPIHPPTQEATAARPPQSSATEDGSSRGGMRSGCPPKLWRRRTCFGGFRRRHQRDHGCKAVGLHFAQGGQTLDQVPIDRLVGVGVRIDVTAPCARNRGYLVIIQDFERWESAHGLILNRSIVLLHTGFARYWPSRQQYLGTELRGPEAMRALHFPGMHPDAVVWLVREWQVKAVEIDTASIEYG
jgi:kynurenine formamidase